MKTKRDPLEAISKGSLSSLGAGGSKLDLQNPTLQPQETSKTLSCGSILPTSLVFVKRGVFCAAALRVQPRYRYLGGRPEILWDVDPDSPSRVSIGNVPSSTSVP